MTISADSAKLLRQALRRGRTPAELRRVFAIVRKSSDRALLKALSPAQKTAPKRKADPLVRDLDLALRPILAPATEKAEMLIEHLAKKHRRKMPITPKGLSDAARQLRAHNLTDDQIRAGARSLIDHLTKFYGGSEGVV